MEKSSEEQVREMFEGLPTEAIREIKEFCKALMNDPARAKAMREKVRLEAEGVMEGVAA